MNPEKLNPEITWIGIDVSKAELEIHSYLSSEKLPKSIPNTKAEISKLITKLKKTSDHTSFLRPPAAMKNLFSASFKTPESRHLASTLRSHVTTLNPKGCLPKLTASMPKFSPILASISNPNRRPNSIPLWKKLRLSSNTAATSA